MCYNITVVSLKHNSAKKERKDGTELLENIKISLKAARVNSGMTLTQASKKLGVSVSTLSRYECGKSYPTVNLLIMICDLYKIPYDNIIFGQGLTLSNSKSL